MRDEANTGRRSFQDEGESDESDGAAVLEDLAPLETKQSRHLEGQDAGDPPALVPLSPGSQEAGVATHLAAPDLQIDQLRDQAISYTDAMHTQI